MTIAPTCTAKGVGTIIPNLLKYPFAFVCIDLKGQNARIAARQRGMFGAVHVLDLFGVTGLASAAFNPLDHIDSHGLDLADDCMTLADALVHDGPDEAAGDPHWNEEAKALIAGILLHIVTTEPPAPWTRCATGSANPTTKLRVCCRPRSAIHAAAARISGCGADRRQPSSVAGKPGVEHVESEGCRRQSRRPRAGFRVMVALMDEKQLDQAQLHHLSATEDACSLREHRAVGASGVWSWLCRLR